ncbi:MAG TPA: hypothetical protein VK742_08260 [Candidatus Sulfotelmatobacter sp.]|jgi:hypothetical protein|nr:hypothetical protein [Candidatus Sulfotelmatobacter sp.]
MLKQKSLRLTVRPNQGDSLNELRRDLGDVFKLKPAGVGSVPPIKLLADLLRRQCRRIVVDVSECPAHAMPGHMARLDDWQALADFHCRHTFAESPESRLSGKQLMYPVTLADWSAVAEITRKEHRAPAFLNSRDEQFKSIVGRLDLLAGLILRDGELTQFLQSEERGES